MKRRSFILGFLSLTAQTLLLRQLIASFYGDELFIGIALFGWLIAVAAGAFIGDRRRNQAFSATFLITSLALLIPASLILVRLLPFWLIDTTGEIIPFSQAALVSIIIMIPSGIVTGCLFPCLSRYIKDQKPHRTIARVYLWEGVGAFIAGLAVTVLAGRYLSDLTVAVVFIMAAFLLLWYQPRKLRSLVLTGAGLIIIIAALYAVPGLDKYIDRIRYQPYNVVESFDTPYGHQALLERDKNLTLLTDSHIEADYPDRENAENSLLPPLLINPQIKDVLYIGRAEMGIAQLADSLGLNITAVDPRHKLSKVLDKYINPPEDFDRHHTDAVKFVRQNISPDGYDLIILAVGLPDNYKTARYFTPEFLIQTVGLLRPDGIVFIPLAYDTDRYISPEKTAVLATLSQTVREVFFEVIFWPGVTTGLIAAPKLELNIALDTLTNRADSLPIKAQYLSAETLRDCLNVLKMIRLNKVRDIPADINLINRPVLVHRQLLYQSGINKSDHILLKSVLGNTYWLIILPVIFVVALVWNILRRKDASAMTAFMFFAAGLVSITLELLVFYLYQSWAGSLYSELAILIGAFMLGLALGTAYAMNIPPQSRLEYPSLTVLLTIVLFFIYTYDRVSPFLALPYFTLLLFSTALATGSLFVAATNRYYRHINRDNRGRGYAWEICGSALGALLVMTVLLPLIGLVWILWSLTICLLIIGAGLIITDRR